MIAESSIPVFHKAKCRIGMVLDQPFPPDARVEREAVALVQAGYEVHLLCTFADDSSRRLVANVPDISGQGGYAHDSRKYEQPAREEAYRGIYIHRVIPKEVSVLIPILNISTRLPYRGIFKNISRALWNLDNAWYSLLDRFVRRYGIDVLHVHDLRLVSTGLAVTKRHQLPLVADLHENYPALMQMLKGKKNSARGERDFEKWRRIERDCTARADQVITVIEEARDRLIMQGTPAEKIIVLPNTVDIAKFERAPVDQSIIRRFKSHFLLTYVGHINNTHRGIHTVLEAMALLKDEIPELFFMGAGAVREQYFAELQALVHHYGLAAKVDFTGWLDETEFVSYIEASDVCICPHLATEHTHTTFPNKVYLYNLFAKPVLVSSCNPLLRYIEESHGGVSFEAGNAEALANQIRMLYDDPELRRQLGEQGQKAVLERFNWNKTASDLVGMYDRLMRIRRAPSLMKTYAESL